MKIPIFIFTIAVLTITTAAGQDTVTRSLGHFTKIEVKNGILVQLIKGDREAVLIKVQEIPINDVITEISDGLLTVRYQAPLFSKSKVMVNIYYRELKSVSASGRM